VCDLLTKLLEADFDDSDFTKRLCEAVRYLCAIEKNKLYFAEVGMCELLTKELMKFFSHSALTSQFLCRAMGHLASGCLVTVEQVNSF
jgi:hypothetical protein